MRSTLLIVCLLLAVIYVQSLTRVERSSSIKKRAPQVYQGQQGGNWNQTQQFQWVKVNNQWVRKDGTNKLPGYSQPNVPYNQTGTQWKNSPASSPASTPAHSPSASNVGNNSKPGQPQRQDSTSSQGSIGWNPSADRALTQDLPKTTPHPTTSTTTTTTTTTRSPVPAQKPLGPTPPPVRAPFGSGMGGQQKPQLNRYNPDASLTYGGLPPQTNPTSNRATIKPNPAHGSNPWGNLSR
ncbi:putative uncharacterized protein DDB_G0290521 [Episyrphus balteatus]|uniref:putative uncharacterized protein DDB_G0290521 n=1 Tax=Episyrphus balteatus TaxID=286459 RepID=UPI0024862A61|nr:putative uncharacterized protein DDB_G0290521 [Episyrphus balteatus]XP_055845963.1 putative uncharacterized protein DDB_G0290521 [Episyrphus balteatus]